MIACTPNVHVAVVPAWARGGFSDARPRMALELGRTGRIVALVFGDPLTSPPLPNRANKILWVARSRRPGDDLRIRAQRMRGTRPVGLPASILVRGGPGPSIINLPKPGCWRLTLRWGPQTDTLDLLYRPPPTSGR